jgi:hypothetical protein
MNKVQINLATGEWTIQGKVLSVNAEATYRVWLAKILLLGEELHQNQWWVEFDDEIFALFAKVKEERKMKSTLRPSATRSRLFSHTTHLRQMRMVQVVRVDPNQRQADH